MVFNFDCRWDRGYMLQGVICYSDDIYGVYLFVVHIYVLRMRTVSLQIYNGEGVSIF